MKNNSSLSKTSGIKFKDKVGYAMGDAAGILTFSVVGAFLQIFYTDVLRISTEKIMVLFIVARLWDAFNDPLWGAFIDHKKPSKNGKFRPYIKWGSLPLAIAGALLFFQIPGLSETQYLIYAYVTYIFYGMMYTVVTIPYGSLASVITTDETERSSLSIFRSVGAGLGGLPGQIILPLFVYSVIKGSDKKALDGTNLFYGILILAVLSIIVYLFCYKFSVERVVATPTGKKNSVMKTIKALLHNRPFIALCIASMLLLATQQYTQTIYNYLFLRYFEKPNLYSLVTICTYLPMIILLPFIQTLVKKFGKKEICSVGMAASFISNLVLFFIKTQNPIVFLVFSFISGFGMMFFILEIWAMATDVIDYQETLSSQRDEGTSYAFFSFTRKLGQTISGVLGTGVLGLIGYKADHVTTDAISKLYSVSTLVPAATCLIMAVTLGIFYSLSKGKLKELYNNTAK